MTVDPGQVERIEAWLKRQQLDEDRREVAEQALDHVRSGSHGNAVYASKKSQSLWHDIIRMGYGFEPEFYERYCRRQSEARRKGAATRRRRIDSGMAIPRDSQRQRLYDAEQVIVLTGPRPEFRTVEQMQTYVDKLLSSAWFQRRWGKHRLTVRPGYGFRRAVAETGRNRIQMPLWARCEAVLLHEIAHHCTWWQHRNDVAPHGREYAANYVELVGHLMGRESAELLKVSFRAGKVKFTKPRAKRELTEEQREELRQRLATARAAKAACVKDS